MQPAGMLKTWGGVGQLGQPRWCGQRETAEGRGGSLGSLMPAAIPRPGDVTPTGAEMAASSRKRARASLSATVHGVGSCPSQPRCAPAARTRCREAEWRGETGEPRLLPASEHHLEMKARLAPPRVSASQNHRIS